MKTMYEAPTEFPQWEAITHVLEAPIIIVQRTANPTFSPPQEFTITFNPIDDDKEFLITAVRIGMHIHNTVTGEPPAYGNVSLKIGLIDYVLSLPTGVCTEEWFTLDMKLRILAQQNFSAMLKLIVLDDCKINLYLKGILYRRRV